MLSHPKSCPINLNHLNRSWNIRYNRQNFLSFWAIFCPFISLTTQKIKIWKNWKQKKKTPEYIIILQICTINDNHIMNLSWDMVRYRHNFLVILDSFLTFSLLPFCPFLPYWPRKLKFWKNVKKFLKILSFNKCVP